MPAATPVTIPVVPILAFALLVLHVPPVTVSVMVVVAPVHTVDAPEIAPAFGAGLTVIVLVAVAVPQPLVTV